MITVGNELQNKKVYQKLEVTNWSEWIHKLRAITSGNSEQFKIAAF